MTEALREMLLSLTAGYSKLIRLESDPDKIKLYQERLDKFISMENDLSIYDSNEGMYAVLSKYKEENRKLNEYLLRNSEKVNKDKLAELDEFLKSN